jgi:hypothetical protein
MTPPEAWSAASVRRWHAYWRLCDTGDSVGAHSGRMAILAAILWRDVSADLWREIALHDVGEIVTGDLPFGAKDGLLGELLAEAEMDARNAMGAPVVALSGRDALRLKFLDRLDAYLWCARHAPDDLARDDWRACRQWLLGHAVSLAPEVSRW